MLFFFSFRVRIRARVIEAKLAVLAYTPNKTEEEEKENKNEIKLEARENIRRVCVVEQVHSKCRLMTVKDLEKVEMKSV